MEDSVENSAGRQDTCKILIIGAGMAGLSAANHLIKNSEPDFLILEARERIGGRIISTQIGNERVELGANWIHGVLGNPVFELAMANGLIDIMNISKPHKVVAAMEDGKQLPFSILEEIYEAYICFLRRCEEYFTSPYIPPDGINSVGEHIAFEADLYLSSLPPDSRRVRKLLFDCLLKRETCITGCDSMKEVNLLEMGSYTDLQGGNISLPEGYSSILGPLTKHIPQERILLRHSVMKIKWRTDSSVADSSLLSSSSSSSSSSSRHYSEMSSTEKKRKDLMRIHVDCENGRRIIAEQLICTLPLGVLKMKAKEIFDPPLPQHKLKAIENLMFGTVNKIFLEYERPFLNPDISEVMLLWDDKSLSEEERQDLSKSWFRKIYSFIKVSETLLLGWISGKAAEYMETLSTAQVSQVCTSILRRFLNDPFVPIPKGCLKTNWHSDPYTLGSYTSMSIGASQGDIEVLAEPLFEQQATATADALQNNNKSTVKMVFAGEHTHSSFYSTVHGAYLTGRSAAQLCLESRKKNDDIKEQQPLLTIIDCDETSADLSSWIQGISLH